MNDLPKWDGAATVYTRLAVINSKLCADAYAAGKRKGKRVEWPIPEAVSQNIEAMNSGDEEACKAGVARHLHLVDFE